MEEDDEFGDLYTDVLRPLATSFQSQSQQPSGPPPPAEQKEIAKAASSTSFQKLPIDLNLNSDDDEDEGSYVAPNSNSAPQNQTLASVKPGFNFRPSLKGFDLNEDSGQAVGNFEGLDGVESDLRARVLEKKGEGGKLPEKAYRGSSFMDEADIDVVVEERDDKDDDFVVKDDNLVGRTEKVDNFIIRTGNVENFGSGGGESKAGEMGSEAIIPGVSIAAVSGGTESRANQNFEDDWDSDSEDDLQIVLNDNNHGPMGMDRMGGGGVGGDEDDEDGEPLVIVGDNGDPGHQPMMMEEQDWGGEEVGPSGDGDRKELGDAAKVNGVGVAVAPKVGYSNHGYHHPFHSQFKYVRPGAALMPGAASNGPGGTPGQVRPPGGIVPGVGRGRGDWRPIGIKGSPAMQKGFHPGYGMPVWGSGAAGRGYGSGLEFTLPSHKTIFEVDIDSFEEKPWRLPGVDITDFFNFGLNEESWKDYCKQLEQLRLETTMQSKIRVYESGRTDQDYDPDLPPELAAAAGIQEIPSESAKFGKTNGGQNDLPKGPARVRPPLPTGRPIQVETGYGERLPSIDTRKPRISDLDVIIEIVCQDSADNESSPGNDMAEQLDNDLPSQDLREGDEFEDLQQEDTEHNHFPSSYKNRNKEVVGRRFSFSNSDPDNRNEGDGTLPLSSEASPEYHPDLREQTAYPGRNFSSTHEERQTKVRAQGRARERSPTMTNKGSTGEKGVSYNKKEESIESIDVKHSPAQLSPLDVGDAAEQEVEPQDAMSDDEIVHSGREFGVDKEELSLNATTNDESLKDDIARNASKKQKLISEVTQTLPQDIDDGEDSRTARSSENGKARSGSSKDYRKLCDGVEEEEVHDGCSARMANVKKSVGGDGGIIRQKVRDERQENERQRGSVKGREDFYPHKGWDPYSGGHSQAKYESIDRRKESENAEGFRQWRDEDLRGRRSRAEDTRKREHRDETGSRHRTKIQEIERSEKDEHHQLRKQLDNGSLRASYDKDIGSRQRDRDDIPKSRNESIDDLHSKRRKEEAHLRRENAEKEEVMHAHRENSSRRKREKDDVYDQRRRDDQARLRDDEQHNVRLKEEGLFQRERNERHREREEWHRIKQSNEETSAKKDKEEARVGTRSGRTMEDKAWGGQSRGKVEQRNSEKEYHSKDAGRQNELLKKRDRVDNESLSQHRGREDAYARGKQLNNDERRARHERASTHDDCAANASDNYKVQEKKHREYSRKAKESEVVDRNSIALSKKNQEENSGQISDMGSLKGRVDQGRSENEILVNNPRPRKHNKEEASSDDEHPESRKGRSKLERWTSHKERDFSISTKSSSSVKIKQIDTQSSTGPNVPSKLPDQPSNTVEDKQHPLGNEKDAVGLEINNSDKKPIEDKHLDTVEKLKKRSERFKLPMPSEKEVTAMKKTENEPIPPPQSENRADSEIKAERPARKRRWTSS